MQPLSSAPLHLAVQYAAPAQDWLPRWRLRRWVQAACAGDAREAVLTLRLVGAREGQALNRDYRGKDYATNVLTFPFEEPARRAARIEADLVLCVPVLVREAREQKKTRLAHAAHLVIHGVLHARGFDHEKARDATQMEKLEATLLRQFGIDDPYTVA
jgi:probable rRNA maturation factor